MRSALIQEATALLNGDGDMKQQIQFLHDKGMTPQEIYTAMAKAGVMVPLQHSLWTSLLLGGGFIYAATYAFQYAMGTLVKPIHDKISLFVDKTAKEIGQLQDHVSACSCPISLAVLSTKSDILS